MFHRFAVVWLVVCVLIQSASANDYLRFLPADTTTVVVLNVSSLTNEGKKAASGFLQQVYAEQFVEEVKKQLELPISDIEQVVVALPHLGGFHGSILLRGKVDAKLLDKHLGGAKNDKTLTIEKMGNPAVPVYGRAIAEQKFFNIVPDLEKVPQAGRALVIPSHAYVAALDEKTLYVSLGARLGGRNTIDRALRARPEKSEPRTSDELTKVLKGLGKDDLATVVLTDGCLHPGLELVVPEHIKASFSQFNSVTMRLQGGKQLGVKVSVSAKSKGDAEKLEETAKTTIENGRKAVEMVVGDEGQRKNIDAMLKTFTLTRKDATLTAEGKLDAEELRKLLPKDEKK